MTTAAAPYCRQSAACSRKASSPSLSEIEFTTALPWTQRRPASITDHFEESIITGTALMSGSVASSRRKRDIAASESSIASSMFTSISWAPASTCWRATSTASSNRSSRISFANFREPVTFVRSPTFTKTLPGWGIATASRPDSRVFGSISGGCRGGRPATASAIAFTWAGVVPQQPPAMFSSPSRAKPPRTWAIDSGVSS